MIVLDSLEGNCGALRWRPAGERDIAELIVTLPNSSLQFGII